MLQRSVSKITNSELKEHVAAISKYCYDENCSDCHFAFNDGDKCILNDEIPCLWEQKIEAMEAMK